MDKEFLTKLIITLSALFIFSVYLSISHKRRYKRYAKREYWKIQNLCSDAELFGHLRHLHPFVFEELVIYALKRKGWKAHHSLIYTGDGGIDGYASNKGVKYFIQDKRYSGYINPEHVQDFEKLCFLNKCRGLFVHTGKTGSLAWEANDRKRIEIVSGSRLIKLMDDEEYYF